MNTNRNSKRRKRLYKSSERKAQVSVPNELIWALIGLLLTILSTFVEVSFPNPPWTWPQKGIQPHGLGVTYQIGAVLLTGCLGGKNAGILSQIAYVFLGLTWLPVFAHGGGIGYLQEPSFGYILGFIPAAWLCGKLAFRYPVKLESLAISAICGLVVIHLCGLIYLIGLAIISPNGGQTLSWNTLPSAIVSYSLSPLPGQLIVICAVVIIAFVFRKLLFY